MAASSPLSDCPLCGARTIPGARFCAQCGASLQGAPGPAAGPRTIVDSPASAAPPTAADPGTVVSLRIYSTFCWGALPGVIDCRSSVSFDGKVLGLWTPQGFQFQVTTEPGVHILEITPPTSFLGRVFSSGWRRPAIQVEIRIPGWYDACLVPIRDGRDGQYRWDVTRRG